MDQASWDDAYANAAHIPGADGFITRWQTAAEAFRAEHIAALQARIDVSYGAGPREVLDLILPPEPPKGLCVFVHGGYWLRFDKSYWTHLAAGPLAQGWAVAMPSYDLCPDVRIADITVQIARAVEYAAALVPGPIALTGHSAGGHLVARMMGLGVLASDVAARVVSCVPISPVSDLAPLRNTSMNADLRIDADAAVLESPVHMTDRLATPVTVWVGADERPVFLDQARWLSQAWGCGFEIAEGLHHFDVIDGLQDPNSALCDAVLGGHDDRD